MQRMNASSMESTSIDNDSLQRYMTSISSLLSALNVNNSDIMHRNAEVSTKYALNVMNITQPPNITAKHTNAQYAKKDIQSSMKTVLIKSVHVKN